MSILTLRNIGKIYNPGKANSCEALRGVDLDIERGDLIAVIGESGSGKSTLLHILGCLDTPTSGEVVFDGKKVNFKSTKTLAGYRGKRIGFVLQDFGLILGETALENVCVPLLFSRTSYSKMKSMARQSLNKLGIGKLCGKRADQLSGGQKQRVAIARALVNDPEIILADEPTGALDSKTSEEIVGLLLELNKKGKTVIIVTHDPKIAAQCRRVVTISDGCLSEG
ncbi:MAG: ABC transporter ATP-binding protein [Oscillospiraceae bacterium]|nr:ABC transporter ATP-binding protein [Oscillospiraceae bacterium]